MSLGAWMVTVLGLFFTVYLSVDLGIWLADGETATRFLIRVSREHTEIRVALGCGIALTAYWLIKHLEIL